MKCSQRRHELVPTAFIVAVGLLFTLSFPGALSAQKLAHGKQAAIPPTLVWPLPPEKPRFRFLAEIHGASDVEPVTKSSRLQRLSGIQKRQFKPTFGKPFGISTDSKHRIYVTDNAQAMVFVLDREKKQVSYIGLDGSPKLRTPMGIVVDAKDRVWLADAGAQRIYAFDSNLVLRASLGKQGELLNPVGLAVDNRRNRLYVADSRQHCIVVYDTETGLMIHKFGKHGAGNGEFSFPTDVSVAADGRLYVADAINRRVQIFDTDFKFVDKFGAEGLGWGDFRRPKSVALDSQQNVYVLDSDFGNFQIFDQKKRLLMFLGEFGEAPGQFSVPQQIRIDSDNVVYVVDQMNARIQLFRLLDGSVEETAPQETK